VQMSWLEQIRSGYEVRKVDACAWMERNGHALLRVAMAVVFIWFGALKPFGLSPAETLVAKATTWIPIPGFLYVLAAWEVTIGVCFLIERLNRWAVILLFLHMPGTLLPLVTLRGDTFVQFPFVPTLEGQYIIKNLVLIAAGIVIGGQLTLRLRGTARWASNGFQALLRRGQAGTAKPGDVLVREGERPARIYFVRSGECIVRVGGRSVGRICAQQFVGEMSLFTRDPASATVEISRATEYVAWDCEELRALVASQRSIEHALLTTVTLDLVGKIQNSNERSVAAKSTVAA